MSVFEYSSCIKIDFDKAILTDVGAVTGTEDKKILITRFAPIASGSHPSYPLSRAFDGSTSTYWMPSSTTVAGHWLGADFGEARSVSKIRAYFGHTYGRPNAYVLQASNDYSTWDDVISGNFLNSSAWQEIIIDGYSYQYWRLVFNSKYSSYYSCSELEFYYTRDTFDTTGWTVTSQEYTTEPNGEESITEHTVRRVSRSEDNKSLYVWLDLEDRLRYPRSVTVSFNGSMVGPGGAQVEPFTETFTPVGITPLFNPNAPDHLAILSPDITMAVKEIEYESYKLDEPADQICILPPSMALTITHVGTLPL